MNARRCGFLMLLLSAAAVAPAASADLHARSLGAQQFATDIQIRYAPEFGRATGRVDSASPSCELNRVIRITATREGADPVLATARTNRRGTFSAQVEVGAVADAGAMAISAEAQVKIIPADKRNVKRVRRCKSKKSRPIIVFTNSGCQSDTQQHPQLPNVDTVGALCPVEVSRIQERGTAPITNFENPGVAIPQTGGEGFRQIPGARLSQRVVEYDFSPPLQPNWLFLNGLEGLPGGTVVRVIIWTRRPAAPGRVQLIRVTTQ